MPEQVSESSAVRQQPAALDSSSWGVVTVALLAGVLAASQVGKVIVALPTVRDDLGMSLTAAGVLLSSYTFVGALLGSVAGGYVDRWGRRRMLTSALLVLAAGAGLGALGPGIPVLLFSRVLEGLGFMGVAVSAPALIASAAAARHRRLALGLWGIYMPLGQFVAIVAGPWLISAIGWRGLWGVNAAALVVCAVLVLAVVPGPTAGPTAVVGSGAKPTRVWRNSAALLIALAFGTYSLQYLAVIGFLPTMYSAGGWADGSAAVLTALVVLGNIVGNINAGLLLHRGVRPGTLIAFAAVSMGVAAILIYANWAPFGLSYTAAVAFALLGGHLPAAVFAAVPAAAAAPGDIGPVNGLVVQMSNVGSIVGPPTVAFVATQAGGWSLSPLVLSSAAVLCLVAGLTLRARDSR
ncbi:cyanate permease [Rhodococcus sp. OK519]|uniref:MFS transporter n=1 Tax=Rhodococcus sp. OK519 TaxID=2135729 RepID=UPI000D3BEE84|nr:cyanate permease [Rhodococcus sp. OK519]